MIRSRMAWRIGSSRRCGGFSVQTIDSLPRSCQNSHIRETQDRGHGEHTMNGTSRQIATAEQIITETLAEVDSVRYWYAMTNDERTAAMWNEDGSFGPGSRPVTVTLWGLKTAEQVDAFCAWLRTLDDAAQVIDWFGKRSRKFRGSRVQSALRSLSVIA